MKIGVLINSKSVRHFEHELLKDLMKIENCDLILSFVDKKQNSKNILLETFLKFDTKLNARGVNYISRKSVDDLNIKLVKDEKVDLFINLTDQNIDEETLKLSKHGLWELRYGDSYASADMAGIMEVFENTPTTPIFLVGNGNIIDKMLCATHEISPSKNRSNIVWKSHFLLVRHIAKFIKDTGNYENNNLYFSKDIKNQIPTICPIIKQGCKNIIHMADRLFRKQQWAIYFALNRPDSEFNQNMSDFKEIPTPKEFFWADPFVVDNGDKSYIFFEEYVYKTHKGHLSVIEYDHTSGEFSDTKEILHTPYHLSYPFMLEFEGEHYMIPEGCKDGDIKLYKATNFPYEWEVERVLIDNIVAADTTIFYRDDTWWMFVNVEAKKGFSMNEELYIYHCKDFLKDEWTAHVQNPIISSVQTSRPAGGILAFNGDYYRPSQNSVGCYGRSTNFNKIVKLTAHEYKEEFISEITPDLIDGIYAVHTYNSSKKMTVIDGLKKIGRFF